MTSPSEQIWLIKPVLPIINYLYFVLILTHDKVIRESQQ